jgi:3-hydroxyacyl-[acyl-carrier-protein] dehydratase
VRFLFIDRIVEVEPGRRLRAVKAIGQMDGYLTAHYTHLPIVPSTLVIEALAQAGGWLNLISRDFGVKAVLGLVEGARILRQVQPGDVMTLDVDLLYVHSDGATVRGQARVGDESVATVERIVFIHAVDRDEAFRQRQRAYFHYINSGRPLSESLR